MWRRHAERLEDVVDHVLLVLDARDLLHEKAGRPVGEVVVFPLCLRRPNRRELGGHRLEGLRQLPTPDRLGLRAVLEPGPVGQDVREGHRLVGLIMHLAFAQVTVDRIVQFELALLGELHDRGCSDGLERRAGAVERLGGSRCAGAHVGIPERRLPDDRVAANQRDRHRRNAIIGECLLDHAGQHPFRLLEIESSVLRDRRRSGQNEEHHHAEQAKISTRHCCSVGSARLGLSWERAKIRRAAGTDKRLGTLGRERSTIW